MEKIEKVINGITDPAAAEWFDINSNSPEAVYEYAMNALSIYLDKDETLFVWDKLNPTFMHKESGDVASRWQWYDDFKAMDKELWGYPEGCDGDFSDWLEVGKLVEVEWINGEWVEV